ncbi:hypothetical protein MP228_000670 [Amoeboaphelidium protococcarum]|nr:hypothetical protein MP228_000670 [Amoeboaphelidium protococcarum]
MNLRRKKYDDDSNADHHHSEQSNNGYQKQWTQQSGTEVGNIKQTPNLVKTPAAVSAAKPFIQPAYNNYYSRMNASQTTQQSQSKPTKPWSQRALSGMSKSMTNLFPLRKSRLLNLNPPLKQKQRLKHDGNGSGTPQSFVHKLTRGLMDTYLGINEKFYSHQSAQKSIAASNGNNCITQPPYISNAFNDGFDDADHNYIIRLDEVLNQRYRVCKVLGRGSFGQVVEAYDIEQRQRVAIKIIKNRKSFHHQGSIELKILQYLMQYDPDDSKNIVRFKHHFQHRNHLCLVYELLSHNLYEMLKNDHFQGLPLPLVSKFAQQILVCLEFLSQRDIQVIHCDLKPENILLISPNSSRLKVIDFGSSCRVNERLYTYIQSRFYRSPEVILGHSYQLPIDMWSFGCMLVELHTGRPLFNGGDEHEQICRFIEYLGMPPKEFMYRCDAEKINRFFTVNGTGVFQGYNAYNPTSMAGREFELTIPTNYKYRQQQNLEQFVLHNRNDYNIDCGNQMMPMEDQQYNRNFMDLISQCLIYDPHQRITPHKALHHPFLLLASETQTPFPVDVPSQEEEYRQKYQPYDQEMMQKEERPFESTITANDQLHNQEKDIQETQDQEMTSNLSHLTIAHRLRPRKVSRVQCQNI